jgi:7-keto-8-aminopelargonate synthetase-like enzyme
VPNVLKSWSLNLLKPSGPVQACNGIAFTLLKLEQRTTIYDKHASILHAAIYCKNKITVMSHNDKILIEKSLYKA